MALSATARWAVLILLFFLSACSSTAPDTRPHDPALPTLRVYCSSPGSTYLPFFAWKEDGSLIGLEPDIIREVARRINANIEFVTPKIPKDLAGQDPRIFALQSDQADLVIFTFPRSMETPERITVSLPYHVEGIGILVGRDSPIRSAGDLRSKRLLAFEGTSAHRWASSRFPTAKIHTSYPRGATGNVIDLIDQGYIDAFLIDRSHLVWIADQSSAVRVLPEQRSQEEFSIAVHKRNFKLLQKINTALVSLHKDGTLRDMQEKWIRR